MKTISSVGVLADLGDQLGHPLLEVTAVARAGDHAGQVELDDPLALELLGDVAGDDALGDALDDGGLADAGLADEHGVVLGAPRQHLEGLVDLVPAADHRVELAGPRQRGEVDAELVEGRGVRSRRCRRRRGHPGRAGTLTTGRGGALQRLRGDALGAERAADGAVVVRGQREHDVLGADVAGARARGRSGARRAGSAWPSGSATAARCVASPRGSCSSAVRARASGSAPAPDSSWRSGGTWVTTSSRCHASRSVLPRSAACCAAAPTSLAGRLGHRAG